MACTIRILAYTLGSVWTVNMDPFGYEFVRDDFLRLWKGIVGLARVSIADNDDADFVLRNEKIEGEACPLGQGGELQGY